MVVVSNASIVANTRNKTLYKRFEKKIKHAWGYVGSRHKHQMSGAMSSRGSSDSKGSRLQSLSSMMHMNKVYPKPQAAEVALVPLQEVQPEHDSVLNQTVLYAVKVKDDAVSV